MNMKNLTESEALQQKNVVLLNTENLLYEGQISLTDLQENLPGWIHLNRLDDMALFWISKNMENDLELESSMIAELGLEYLYEIIHVETVKVVVPILTKQKNLNDETNVISFLQMIRLDTNRKYQLYHTSTKISKKFNCFFCQSIPLHNLEKSVLKYSKLFGDNEFKSKYYSKFMQLTKREKEVLALISEGETNKTISEILNISSLTVKTHRQNIIRKLETKHLRDLIRISREFGLT